MAPAEGSGDGADRQRPDVRQPPDGHQRDEGERLLRGAYALDTPDQHRDFYARFADHYDTVFAGGLGYVYHAGVAAALDGMVLPDGPILDIGCGTGLVAAAIRSSRPDAVIHGVDISPAMLGKAREKGDYASLTAADLTGDFSHLPRGFAAFVSAGTFTHGHLGPAPLPRLLDHGMSGAIAAIGVNSVHFERHGFASVLDDLVAAGRITSPVLKEVPIYDGSNAEHAGDIAFILCFTTI